MSNTFKISTARLAEIIKEEYASILQDLEGMSRLHEAETVPRDERIPKKSVGTIRDLIKQELKSL